LEDGSWKLEVGSWELEVVIFFHPLGRGKKKVRSQKLEVGSCNFFPPFREGGRKK